MPAYDLQKTERYPSNLVNPPAIEQRLSGKEMRDLRKNPLELIFAQNIGKPRITINNDATAMISKLD